MKLRCVSCGKMFNIVMTKDQFIRYEQWYNNRSPMREMLYDLSKQGLEMLAGSLCSDCVFGTFLPRSETNISAKANKIVKLFEE